jgi:hypothetical protein
VGDDYLDVLSEAEQEAIIMALARARHAAGDRFTADDAALTLSWANRTRMEGAMLSLVLKGLMNVDVQGDLVTWTLAAKEEDHG